MSRIKTGPPRKAISIRRKLLYTSTVCAVVIVFAVGGAEVLLRGRYGKIERITGAAEWKVGQYGNLTYHWDQYHPLYGWTNAPGYTSDERIPFRLTINGQGLRGPRDYNPTPSAGMTRIAIFGDSCTFGEEVDDDQTISHHLEQHLQQTEVLNYGVHGYGLGQMALRLEEEGFELNPQHVVIVILLPMDIDRDSLHHFVYNKPVFSAVDGDLQVDNVPVPEASQMPWLYRRCFTAAWCFTRAKENVTSLPEEELVATTQAILRRAMELCDGRGVKLTVVTMVSFPTLDQLNSQPQESGSWDDPSPQLRGYLDYLTRSIKEVDADFLDLTNYLETTYTDEGDALTMKQGHWSGRGNSLIAQQIADHLSSKNNTSF
jgi:hypothetical protein